MPQQVLKFLDQYRYARLEHALMEVLWHTGLRIGAAIGLDKDDYDADDQYLTLAHRPEEGTSLKNGRKSERLVALMINDQNVRNFGSDDATSPEIKCMN